MKRVTAYVEDELKEKIQKYCKKVGITESAFIKMAAYETFKKEEK